MNRANNETYNDNTGKITSINKLKMLSIKFNFIVKQQRRLFLQNYLEKNNVDIALICERKLNGSHKISFVRPNFIRNDRNNSQFWGGTGIVRRGNFRSP